MKIVRLILPGGILVFVILCGWLIWRANKPGTAPVKLTGSPPVAAQSRPASGPVLESPRDIQEAARGGYAGSAGCRECHEQACDEWRDSHHARAQRDPSPPLDGEAFAPPRTIKHGTQADRAEQRGQQYILTLTGSDGQPHEYSPTGVIGVDPLWQYLIAQAGGRRQVTELAWDPHQKEWFNIFGNEDRKCWEWGQWSNRGMNWNSMCATCHTTHFQKNYEPAADVYASVYVEQGVGCEQCHGPLREHVDWQKENPGSRPGSDPTIRPMDREEYFSVCASCHARRSELTGSFQAGEDFLEHYEPVLPDLLDTFYPDGQVRDEDFEYAAFSLSYMYAWGVRCMDCHFWHEGKVARTGNALCLRCHERPIGTKMAIEPQPHSHHPPDKAGFACTDCHLPQTVYMARHSRHDHGMTIPDPRLSKATNIPNACSRCHEKEGLDWNIGWVEKWYGPRMDRPTRRRAELLANIKGGDLHGIPQLLKLLGEEKNPHWRAVYVKFLSAAVTAERSTQDHGALVREMLRLLDDPSPLVQGTALEALEPLAESLREQLAGRLNSPHRLVRVKAAWALRRRLDWGTPAGRDLLVRIKCSEDQPLGAMQWAQLLVDTGRLSESLPWFEKAIRWDPGSAIFRHSYAVTLSQLDRPQQAVEQLAEAARMAPADALYPYSLGLIYGEMNELAQARAFLQKAVDLDPMQSRYWYNLALADFRLGHGPEAIGEIARARELAPGAPDYAYAQATMYFELRQYQQAWDALQQTLELDPDHPQGRQLLSELEPLLIMQRANQSPK